MRSCGSQCQGIEKEFNEAMARRELARYRRNGPGGATRLLLRALRAQDVRGQTLLDVGGGVGALQHDLLAAGVERAVGVEASAAYLVAAQEEARRRGDEGRVTYLHGDFVQLAALVPPADIVTLDKVICCYDDMRSLVSAAAARTRRMLGAVFPRDTWWTRLGIRFVNFLMRLRRSPFRTFVHPPGEVDAILRRHGLTPQWRGRTFLWFVRVYTREAAAGER
jgi:hypothetical protein